MLQYYNHLSSREVIIVRYDVILNQSELMHLYNPLSNYTKYEYFCIMQHEQQKSHVVIISKNRTVKIILKVFTFLLMKCNCLQFLYNQIMCGYLEVDWSLVIVQVFVVLGILI